MILSSPLKVSKAIISIKTIIPLEPKNVEVHYYALRKVRRGNQNHLTRIQHLTAGQQQQQNNENIFTF